MSWLRSRLVVSTLVVLLLATVTPLIVLSIIGIRGYRARGQSDIDATSALLNERSLDLLEARAADTAYALAEFLWQRDGDLRTLAQIPRTEMAYLDFARTLQRTIETTNISHETVRVALPLYREVTFIRPNGREELKVASACADYPWGCQLVVAETLVDVSDPANTTYGAEDYFQAAQELRPGEIYVGRPIGRYVPFDEAFKSAQFPDGQRFEGIIRFIMPVYGESGGYPEGGELEGYVALALDHTHVLSFIDHLDPTATRPLPSIDPSADNFAYIIGSDGTAVAHLLHYRIAGVDEQGEWVGSISEDNLDGPGNFYAMGFLSPVFPQLMENSLILPQGVVDRYEVNGKSRSLAYSVIPYNTGPNYDNGRGFGLVIATVDYQARQVDIHVLTAQQNEALSDLVTQFGTLVALAIFVVGAVTLGFAHYVVRPIRNITGYAAVMEERRLTDEEIAFLKDHPGQGEIGQMARRFGAMAETVRSREQQISEFLQQTDESLNRRLQELATLGEIGRKLTSTLDLQNLLEFATKSLLDMTHARAVQLVIEPEEGSDKTVEFYTTGDTSLIDEETANPVMIDLELEGRTIGEFILHTPNDRLEGIERVFADQLASWVSIAVKNSRQFTHIQEQQHQLEVTNQKIIEANRLKSEFLSTMSHELRTPLNAIIGFCGIMLEGVGGQIDDDARHMLTRIDSNSKRLLELINGVLDIAKIESGRLDLAVMPFSPQALVAQWKSQMAVLAEQKNLEFEVQMAPALPRLLLGDEKRISQVAINLLSNAFKFTEKGKVTLVLDWQDDHWVIRVTDTGIGIPLQATELIFDEFRQIDGTPRRIYGGTGLGLAIVRNLCTLMDGTIKVESKVGQGSTFTVTLPLSTPLLTSIPR